MIIPKSLPTCKGNYFNILKGDIIGVKGKIYMGLHLPKFKSILDDIGSVASNAVHTLGNAAGTAIDAAIPGNQSSLHQPTPTQQPPVGLPHNLDTLGSQFAGITGGVNSSPFHQQIEGVISPVTPVGSPSTPAANQQPIQVGALRPPQLQVATPSKPNGQPLTATVVKTPSLQVGNQQIAQSPTAVSGVQAPQQKQPTLLDQVGKVATTLLSKSPNLSGVPIPTPTGVLPIPSSSAFKSISQPIARGFAELPASVADKSLQTQKNPITKNIFGDAPIKPIQQDVAGVYNAVKAGHQNLPGLNLPISPSLAAPIAAGDAALHLAQDIPEVGAAAKVAGRATGLADALKDASPILAKTLRAVHTPLGEAGGAKAGDILPEKAFPGEQNTNKTPLPFPDQTTSPTGVDNNLGATGGVGQGNSNDLERALQNLHQQNDLAMSKTPKLTTKASPQLSPETQSLLASEPAPQDFLKTADVNTGQRNIDAERAALEHLQNGGTRDTAASVYKDMTGATLKDSRFQVQRAAREAKQSLNANPAGINPELENFKYDSIEPGNHAEAAKRPGIVKNVLNIHENNTLKSLGELSPADRANYIHYVQGTEDISKADNPALVQKAVDAFQKGANTTHALDTNLAGGRTRFIQNFFPDYWDNENPANQEVLQHKAEQAIEEELGPNTWNSFTAQEKAEALGEFHQNRTLDTGNYTGFHNQQRVFANRKEGLAAGFKPLSENPGDDIKRYFAGAKLNISNQALIRAARQADRNESDLRNPIPLPGGPTLETSDKGLKAFKQFARREASNPVAKVFRGTTRAVVKGIVTNPTIHGVNQEFNATFNTAFRMPGNKVTNAIKILANQARINPGDIENFYKEGNFSPDYGKDQYGFIAKGLEKSGIDPKYAELSPRAMAGIEQTLRVAIWKRGKELTQSPADITEAINKSLGGPDLLSDTSSAVGIFGHYLKTNLNLLKDSGTELAHGRPSQAIGVVAGLAAWEAGNEAWKKITGNPNASIRAPGFAATATQLVKGIGQAQRGQIPSILTSHTNPLITSGIEELTNRNLRNPIFGPQGQNNNLDGERLKVIAGNLLGPAQSVQSVAGQKTSPAEAATGYLSGLYTPHAKGYQAAPNIPVLNASNAKAGNGLDQQKQYFSALDNLQSSVSNDKRARDIVNAYLDRNKNAQGQTVQLSPGEALAAAAGVASNPKALKAIQQFKKSSDANHDPMWDLSTSDLKQFLQFQATRKTDPEADVKKDLGGNFNGGEGLNDFIKRRDAYYSTVNFNSSGKGSVPAPGTPQYPKFSADQQSHLDEYGKISDSSQKAQYINNHPDVVDAFNALAKYKNDVGVAQGGNAQKTSTGLSPEAEKAFNQYNQLPKGTGARTNWIKENPKLWGQITGGLANTAIYNISKEGAKNLYQGEQPSQKLLKNVYNAGKYDVTKNSDGTYSLGTVSGGGGSSYQSNFSSAGGTGNLFPHSAKSVGLGIASIHTAHKPSYFNTRASVKARGRGKVKLTKTSKPKTLKVASVKGTLG